MPRSSEAEIAHQLDALSELIARRPEGIGSAELSREYEARQHATIGRRTLLRRLEQLLAAGRIEVRSEGRQRVYRSAAAAAEPAAEPTLDDAARATIGAEEGEIPLSREGAEVRAMVRRPIAEREPVGYDLEFLESYRPGTTWYLPEDLRRRLHAMGATPAPERAAGTFARDVFDRLLIDLSWASSRLEGNTYSRLDTQNLIEFGQFAEGKDAQQAQMILNHKRAIEFLVEEAEAIRFDRRTVTTLHSALSDNLLMDDRDEGSLRRRPVWISGSTYVPTAIPQVIEDAFDVLLDTASAIPDPFEQAFFAMIHIPYLQPFADVNKRTSRLAANISLIRANLCPLSFVDVPERPYVEGTLGVYEARRMELLRDVFVWAYTRSCDRYKIVREAMGTPDPLRLRYRTQLGEAVRDTVVALAPPNAALLRRWAEEHGIPAPDVGGFAERALSLLVNLHEGTAGRYRIRPSELHAWLAAHRR
jgi:hypothetical protein